MAVVDKSSVRSQFTFFKDEFKDLKNQGKLNSETESLMRMMIQLFEILISIFLEKKTKKTSRNSSIPKSQMSGEDKSAKGKRSKPSSKIKLSNDLYEKVSEKIINETSEVNFCTHCAEDLKNEPCIKKEKRTKIDIIFEKRVINIEAEVKHCPKCDQTTKGWFPSDMKGKLQYGDGIKVFVLNLLFVQMVSLNRVQKMLQPLIGRLISEATFLGYVLKFYHALETWEIDSKKELLLHKRIHCDETSMKVNKKKHWVHVYSSGDIVLKFMHQKRGKAAIDDIDIIPKYKGVIIHDCWAPYFSYIGVLHGICGGHLVRELRFVIDSNEYKWADRLKRLLQNTSRKISKRKSKRLTKKEYLALQKNYRTILTQGEKEMPSLAKNKTGKKRIAKWYAHNLWERFRKHESSILLFAKESHVPFTNNRAERDLRMNKVKQNVSGTFRSELMGKAYCRITSYIKTRMNQGVNPLMALHEVSVMIKNKRESEMPQKV